MLSHSRDKMWSRICCLFSKLVCFYTSSLPVQVTKQEECWIKKHQKHQHQRNTTNRTIWSPGRGQKGDIAFLRACGRCKEVPQNCAVDKCSFVLKCRPRIIRTVVWQPASLLFLPHQNNRELHFAVLFVPLHIFDLQMIIMSELDVFFSAYIVKLRNTHKTLDALYSLLELALWRTDDDRVVINRGRHGHECYHVTDEVMLCDRLPPLASSIVIAQ